MESKYNTTYVENESSLPPEGVKCIKCGEDTLRKGRAEWGGGLYCPSCKWKWKISKFSESSPKTASTYVQESDQGNQILEAIANLRMFEREAAGIIRGDVKTAKEEILEAIKQDKIIYPKE